MYNVYQHWDPLKVCVVGQTYPPEFYSWIKIPHVRKLFEKISQETQEDLDCIISKLEEFGVEIVRPVIPTDISPYNANGYYSPPPLTPRDYMVMITNDFYANLGIDWEKFYLPIKDKSWPDYESLDIFLNTAPKHIVNEAYKIHNLNQWIQDVDFLNVCYNPIIKKVKTQGNNVTSHFLSRLVNGSMVSRIGRDLYFGTETYNEDVLNLKGGIDKHFLNTRNHIVNTGGHSDATYCPVCPGLIISLEDIPTYNNTFPDWEIIYLKNEGLSKIKPFADLKRKNQGRWWIPGFEYDQDVVDVVETWLGHWTGYVEETVFDVNMLIIDPKNVMVFNYNKQVFDALNRYGITPHIVPFRHRYFWDGGIHCVTLDLHREGVMQDYFPNRT